MIDTWKGNDYQAVWWDETERFEDHARSVRQRCADDLTSAVDRMLEAWDRSEIRGKFWAGKLPDTVSNADLEAALSSKVNHDTCATCHSLVCDLIEHIIGYRPEKLAAGEVRSMMSSNPAIQPL